MRVRPILGDGGGKLKGGGGDFCGPGRYIGGMPFRRPCRLLLLALLVAPLGAGCGESKKRQLDRREVRLSQAESAAAAERADAAAVRQELTETEAQLAAANRRLTEPAADATSPAPPPPTPVPVAPAAPATPVDVVGEYEKKIADLRAQVQTLSRTLDLKDDQISLLLKELRGAGAQQSSGKP